MQNDVFSRLARILDRETLISERAAILFDVGPKGPYNWLKIGPPEMVLRLIEFMEEWPVKIWPEPMRQRFEKAQAIGQRKSRGTPHPPAQKVHREAKPRKGGQRRTRARKLIEGSDKIKVGARA